MISYSVAQAKARLCEILKRVEDGEEVRLTRRGKPVARVVPDRRESGKRNLGWAKGQIRLLPGWDGPITEEELLGE